MAGRIAMSEGMPKCSPVLLEPISAVKIAVPSEATAKINGIISARRGQILGFDARPGWNGWDVIEAHIPEAEIHDLIIELRSVTAGAGSSSRSSIILSNSRASSPSRSRRSMRRRRLKPPGRGSEYKDGALVRPRFRIMLTKAQRHCEPQLGGRGKLPEAIQDQVPDLVIPERPFQAVSGIVTRTTAGFWTAPDKR